MNSVIEENGVKYKRVSKEEYEKWTLSMEKRRLERSLKELDPTSEEYGTTLERIKTIELVNTQKSVQFDKIMNVAKNVGILIIGAAGLVLSLKLDSSGTLPRWTDKITGKLIKF